MRKREDEGKGGLGEGRMRKREDWGKGRIRGREDSGKGG